MHEVTLRLFFRSPLAALPDPGIPAKLTGSP
jgi:hypothetical protein